jgi:hypothetical protein
MITQLNADYLDDNPALIERGFECSRPVAADLAIEYLIGGPQSRLIHATLALASARDGGANNCAYRAGNT